MKLRNWFMAAAALIMLFALSACGGGNTATDGGTTTASAEAIYKKNCVTCHGADLKGQNLNTVGARLSKDEIYAQIREGGGGMMAFKGRLSDADIDTLANWLVEMK